MGYFSAVLLIPREAKAQEVTLQKAIGDLAKCVQALPTASEILAPPQLRSPSDASKRTKALFFIIQRRH
jgi:hypothetical protein